MKRSGPPQRRTPLAPSSGLRRTFEPRPRTPLKARSAKTSAVYADTRRPLVSRPLTANPRCQLAVLCGGTATAVDVHEILSRARGVSIVDPDNCLTACRPCHTWVTEHDAAAQCLGLTLPGWVVYRAAIAPPDVFEDPWTVAADLRAGTRPCPWHDGACGQSTPPQPVH